MVETVSRSRYSSLSDTSTPALYLARVLDQDQDGRGLPKVTRTDDGPEFGGRAVHGDWAAKNGVELHPTRRTQDASATETEGNADPFFRGNEVSPISGQLQLHDRRGLPDRVREKS